MQYALQVRPPEGELFYIALPETGSITVGRDPSAHLVLQDRFMSRTHFHLQWGPGRISFTDPGSSNGTFVNGVRLASLELKHGDALRAGKSVFRLTAVLEGVPALKDDLAHAVKLTSLQAEMVAGLAQSCPFAVLDGASDPLNRELLNGTGAVYQTLYEGQQAVEVAPFGPFLVDLQGAQPLLQQLIVKGWGKSWGIFLRSEAPFEEVRKHLRRFLTIQAEDGRRLLFRFYDPRVLRVFLPTCEAAQRAEFFGPVQHFVIELPESERFGVLGSGS